MNFIHWNKLNCNLIWAYEGRVPDNGNRTGLIDNKYSVWFIKSGNVKLTGNTFKSCYADSGQWVFTPTACSRDQYFLENSSIMSISFFAEWPNGTPLFPITTPLILNKTANGRLMSALKDLIRIGGGHIDLNSIRKEQFSLDPWNYIDIQCSFWNFIREWATTIKHCNIKPAPFPFADKRSQAIADIIDSLPFTGRIPYHYLEEKICLSRVHIDRVFLKATGRTPKEHMENNIFRKAEKLLLGSNESIKQIAVSLGFSTSSHFCAWFKRLCGIYPDEYRKRS